MGKLLLFAFTIIPLLEIFLLTWVGARIGFKATVGIVLVTGLLGAALAKREGLRVLREWQASLSRAQMPQQGVLDGVLVLVGGIFLVTPGILTDVAGLALLFPPTRRLVGSQIRARIERGIANGSVRVQVGPSAMFGSAAAEAFARAGAARERPTGAVIDVPGREVSSTEQRELPIPDNDPAR